MTDAELQAAVLIFDPVIFNNPANQTAVTLASLGIPDNGRCTVLSGGTLPTVGAATAQHMVQVDDNGPTIVIDLRNPASVTTLTITRTTGACSRRAGGGHASGGDPFKAGMAIIGDGTARGSINGAAVVQAASGDDRPDAPADWWVHAGSVLPSAPATFVRVYPGYAMTDAELQAATLAP